MQTSKLFPIFQTMKEEKKTKETPNVVPLIETTPPSPHTNGSPGQFNGSPVHTGRRASEPLDDKLSEPGYNSGRSSSFSDVPSVQLTPPPSRKQKPLALVCRTVPNNQDLIFSKVHPYNYKTTRMDIKQI